MSVRFVIMRYKVSRTIMYIYYIFDGFGTSVKICCRAPWELGTRICICLTAQQRTSVTHTSVHLLERSTDQRSYSTTNKRGQIVFANPI